MRLGDLLECLSAAALVGGAYFATHLAWPPLLVAGAGLAYFGQCYANTKIPRPRLPRLRAKRDQ